MGSSRIRVKMCGMTRTEDVAYAIKSGADAIGLIFYSQSSRYITIDKAHELLNDLPPFISPVAVFVNPEKTYVEQIINKLPIQSVQFHGDETPEFCKQFCKPFIKAIQPENTMDIKSRTKEFSDAQAILLDTPSLIARGGTGVVFDWRIIPKNASKPYILAGGLNALNITDAVHACNPYAVDVCSGIEVLPGIKDPLKMSQFIKALRCIQ